VRKLIALSLITLALMLFTVPVESIAEREDVIILGSRSADELTDTIERLGGVVIKKYQNVNALAVSMPRGLRAEVDSLAGVEAIVRDEWVPPPRPIEAASLGQDGGGISPRIVVGEELAEARRAHPYNYTFSNQLTGASIMHGQGFEGDGVIVALIDTGVTNEPVSTPALYDWTHGVSKVIGGESFVGGASEPSATSSLNDPHGTWAACMIAADVGFIFDNDDPFSPVVSAVTKWAPGSIIPVDAATSMVPMRGTAPGAQLYAMKVFPSTGGSTPSSLIMAAMDRAITLRRNFNDGVPSVPVAGSGTEDDPFVYDSLRIDVVNMSLGGSTLYAGRNLMDSLTQSMLAVGIVPVVSAGNAGPAAMTGGSPGTGFGALTVGAASTATHERIAAEIGLVVGSPVDGDHWRASAHVQTAYFSSRGPTADGRMDPEVLAHGHWVFTNAPYLVSPGTVLPSPVVWWVSGTSFAAPAVAGAAALLRQAAPSATATQIRKALTTSADSSVLGDMSKPIDRGKGFIDVPAALDLLLKGRVSNRIGMGSASPNVIENVRQRGFNVIARGAQVTLNNLMPGQVKHFFVRIDRRTHHLDVALENIQPALDPFEQNPFFGDDLFLSIVDSPTSFEWTLAAGFVNGNVTVPIDDPQHGLVRIAVMGDWTNAGPVSAHLRITRQRSDLPEPTAVGSTPSSGACQLVDAVVPPGVSELAALLTWKYDWGFYPTNDLDLYVVDPSATVDSSATMASPERVTISNPAPGAWSFFVCGVDIHQPSKDKWQLRVTADGERLGS
jgi:subtilisin family serine protease